MAPASSSSTRKSIRPHRKSRTGCSSCKRRKVKCDEEKPCSNCIRFGLHCDLAPDSARVEHGTIPIAQRGRGRPRKTWAQPAPTDSTSTASPPPPPKTIDINQAELLLHFTSTTAPTLGGCECPHQLAFWTRNVPCIGLTYPFVLHLLLAAAAFHLAYLVAKHRADTTADATINDASAPTLPLRLTRVEYLALAQQHLTAGVSGFSAELARPAPENCGALYLGAVLTCYCTFADGPRGRDDLLVCTVEGGRAAGEGLHDDDGSGGDGSGGDVSPAAAADSSSSSAVSMPFVYGVRLMHESFSPDVLFAGPMESLAKAPRPLEEQVYARDRFPRLEWEAQLDGLRGFIAARCAASGVEDGGQDDGTPTHASQRVAGEATRTAAAVSLKALDCLIGIYGAIYGRRGPDGQITLDGPSENQFVFGWLYRLEPEFAACVRRCESYALLALAHYALLLNGDAVPGGWYVEGWREHIVARVGELLGDGEGSEWMCWPLEQAAVNETRQRK